MEQIIVLRKKVMNHMKAKMINGQPMSGELWIALVEQYLGALNNGTVPSIESSWTYICQNKGRELFEKLKADFEASLAKDVTGPMSEADLLQCFEFHSEKFKTDLTADFASESEF